PACSPLADSEAFLNSGFRKSACPSRGSCARLNLPGRCIVALSEGAMRRLLAPPACPGDAVTFLWTATKNPCGASASRVRRMREVAPGAPPRRSITRETPSRPSQAGLLARGSQVSDLPDDGLVGRGRQWPCTGRLGDHPHGAGMPLTAARPRPTFTAFPFQHECACDSSQYAQHARRRQEKNAILITTWAAAIWNNLAGAGNLS